jgi:hypothetical protein
LRTPRKAKQWIAWLALCCVSNCYGTTVVTLVTAHGIVICADGKVTQGGNDPAPRKLAISEQTSQKSFLIQERNAVSHTGIIELTDVYEIKGNRRVRANIPYSAGRIITEVRREFSPLFTTAKLADLIRNKLITAFAGFDVLLNSGSLRPEMLPPPHDLLTEFTIAGFDGETAHVYSVGVDINWRSLSHAVEPIRPIYPGIRKNLSLTIAGHSDAIVELWNNRSGIAARQLEATLPLEYGALQGDRDLEIDHMTILARALVILQIQRSPQAVGYPLTVITIPKSGRTTTRSYDDHQQLK